jgi:ketosteroid isomerase-like protein
VEKRELVLAGVDAMQRGDKYAVRACLHPDLVFHPIRAAVSGEYYGHAGMDRFIDDNAETFDHFEVRIDEIQTLDDDRLLVLGTASFRGKGSQVATTVPTAGIVTFKDGLIAGWHDYGDRAAAREAAGL